MSRHDGVSCDSCLKSNFRGRRYKCLICYDYDLCATCYESGATSTRHTTDHPVQCIITRSDFDIYYGGEALTPDQPQAYSCPYCSKMGFTEALLQEHVSAEHADTSNEVVCPICASLPGGDPNHVTDDFAAHLTLEHRAPREFDEPTGIRHVRRIPHPGRGVSGARTRRATNMHFSSGGTSLTSLSPSGRDVMDPIAELLSQLSSVRSRAAAAQSVTSQLQQLEMQLQSTRQQLERTPGRRQVVEAVKAASGATALELHNATASTNNNNSTTSNSLYLLSRYTDGVANQEEEAHQERSSRSLFVQELLLSTLTEHWTLNENPLGSLDQASDTGSTVLPSLREPSSSSDSDEKEVDRSNNSSSIEMDRESTSVSATAKSQCSEQNGNATGTNSGSKTVGNRGVEKVVGTKQKVFGQVTSANGRGASSTMVSSRGVRQSSIPYQNSGERHSQAVHSMRQGGLMQNQVDLANNLALNMGGHGGGAADNPQPLPGRPGSGGRERDGPINPATAKRNMVKHYPASKATDREPPPH